MAEVASSRIQPLSAPVDGSPSRFDCAAHDLELQALATRLDVAAQQLEATRKEHDTMLKEIDALT